MTHPRADEMTSVTLYFNTDEDKRRFMREILTTHTVRWDGGADRDFDYQTEYEIVYWNIDVY